MFSAKLDYGSNSCELNGSRRDSEYQIPRFPIILCGEVSNIDSCYSYSGQVHLLRFDNLTELVLADSREDFLEPLVHIQTLHEHPRACCWKTAKGSGMQEMRQDRPLDQSVPYEAG